MLTLATLKVDYSPWNCLCRTAVLLVAEIYGIELLESCLNVRDGWAYHYLYCTGEKRMMFSVSAGKRSSFSCNLRSLNSLLLYLAPLRVCARKRLNETAEFIVEMRICTRSESSSRGRRVSQLRIQFFHFRYRLLQVRGAAAPCKMYAQNKSHNRETCKNNSQ